MLAARPDTPEAEHLLGVLLHQTGKAGEANERKKRYNERYNMEFGVPI